MDMIPCDCLNSFLFHILNADAKSIFRLMTGRENNVFFFTILFWVCGLGELEDSFLPHLSMKCVRI